MADKTQKIAKIRLSKLDHEEYRVDWRRSTTAV